MSNRRSSVPPKNTAKNKLGFNPICGIYNLGNNCYLNSGLQILASCDKLVDELDKYNNTYGDNIINLLKTAFDYLLNKTMYNPKYFINEFSKKNNDFVFGTQCCSQNFIRTLIRNINEECIKKNLNLIKKNYQYQKSKNLEYQKFVANIYPESKAQSIFSGLSESHSKGKCPYCKQVIDKYSYNFFIDQIIYLDDLRKDKYNFKDILNENLGIASNLIMDCPNPNCGEEIKVEEETKIIKLPEILIFTLERYQGNPNRVKIEPDPVLEMKYYIDKSLNVESTEYELFAINIRFGSTINFGHEICQVKRKGVWYEINDSSYEIIDGPSNFGSSYGLFYRMMKHFNDSEPEKNVIENEIIEENKIIPGKEMEIESNIQDSTINGKNIKEISNVKVNIDNNNSSIIEAIDICREVILNNIKNKRDYDAFINILNKKYSKLKASECSQKNIIKLIQELKNVNKIEYSKFELYTTNYYTYECYKCRNQNYKNHYGISGQKYHNNHEKSFNIDFNLNMKNINSETKFKYLLKQNFNKHFYKKDKCEKKHEIYKYRFIKINKLPEILIFTIDRNKANKTIKIIPDNTIYLSDYIDNESSIQTMTTYKLFALNLLIDEKLGYEFHFKIDDKWYLVKNHIKYNTNINDYSEYICGLFYKRN